MKTINLSRGYTAIVDNEDYDELSKYKWSASTCGKYAYRITGKRNGKRRTVRMHRVIIDIESGMETDHVNGNGLDNRRCNLRQCTRSQNMFNRPALKNNKSGYKGVYWSLGKWRAAIQCNKITYRLGGFDDKKDAAIAYNNRAQELFGEFAWLNPV